MVIKFSQMGMPVLLSCSGTTPVGPEMAKQFSVTLIFLAKGRHLQVLKMAPSGLSLR